jgi:putative SOS response-associated peptidase YedK
MCGRYASFTPPDSIRRLVNANNVAPNFEPTWNLAPSQKGLVVRRHPETGERNLDALQWGFVPNWTKDLKSAQRPINARAETVATSGMFRASMEKRHCLVPADAFYEWWTQPSGKQPFAMTRQDGQPMMFAGLWDGWRGQDGEIIRSYVIITCAANRAMAQIHNRMPVILEPDAWALWLAEKDGEAGALLRPAGEDVLKLAPVDKAVGNVRNNGQHLLNSV